MGTSKANIGPKNNSSPIQSWNDEYQSNDEVQADNSSDKNIDQEDVDDQNTEESTTGNWSNAKRSYAAFVKAPTKSNFKKFSVNYKKAAGGTKNLSRSSIGGKKGAKVLFKFLTSLSQRGITDTFENFRIGDISNLKAEGAVNKICLIFKDIDGTDEGSAANAAAVETIDKLYNDYASDFEKIESLSHEEIGDYLEFYISQYIFERISIEITKALEKNTLSRQQVADAHDNLKAYIEAEVNLNFDNINFSSIDLNEENQIINRIFEDAYSLI